VSIPLAYDISIIGDDRLKRVMRSVEQEAARSSKRADASFSKIGTSRGSLVDKEQRARASAEAALQRQRSSALMREYSAKMREERRLQSEKERNIKKAADLEERAAKKASEVRKRAAERMGSRMAGSVYRGTGRLVGIGGTVLAAGGALVGGASAVNAVQNRMDVHAQATALANQAAGNEGEKRSREQIKADVLAQTRGIDRRTGIGEGAAMSGLREFNAISGQLGAAQKILPFIVDLADATDANVGDLGRTGGQVYQAVQLSGESDPSKALEKTKEILIGLTQQTKNGSIEMADFSQHMSQITSAAGRFSGDAPALIKFMGALAQLAVAGGGDPAEATTAVARVPSDITKHTKDLQALGVDPFTDKSHTALKDPSKMLPEILEKTGGNLEKVSGVFDERAIKAFEPLRKTYVTAEKKKKGSGRAAVEKLLEPLTNTTLTEKDITAGARFRQSDEDRKLAMIVGEFNREVGERLIPKVRDLIPVLERAVPALGALTDKVLGVADFFARNPFTGIGAVIATSIAAEVGKAQIAMIIEKAFRTALGGGGGGGGAIPTPGGGGGPIGKPGGGGSTLGRLGQALPYIGAAIQGGMSYIESVGDLSTVFNRKRGDELALLFGGGIGRASTPEEYDRQMRVTPAPGALGNFTKQVPQPVKVDASEAQKQLAESARDFGKTAAEEMRKHLPGAPRTTPLVGR
jgi:hypothetical protein